MSEIPMYPDETREVIDVAKLADTVREVRRDLTRMAYREPLPGWEGQKVCTCGLDPQRCDTSCDPRKPHCTGPAIRHAIRRLSDALL